VGELTRISKAEIRKSEDASGHRGGERCTWLIVIRVAAITKASINNKRSGHINDYGY